MQTSDRKPGFAASLTPGARTATTLARTALGALLLGLGAISMTATVATAQIYDVKAETFETADQALIKGVEAFNRKRYDKAIPALQRAAEGNLFLGQYYLARIYADNDGAFTDHPKAYMLYHQIARDFADVEPEDQRATFVARSLVALAAYVRRGLPEMDLRANRRRAADFLEHAAIYFNDENAQFELAKMMIQAANSRTDSRARQGLDWLSLIARRGHAGAQAFLADLLWRGKFTTANPIRALALIAVASKNAPDKDTFWIDDIFQNIYCGASEGVRRQATGLVADWDSRYGRKPQAREGDVLSGLSVRTVRSCANGEVLPRLNVDKDGRDILEGWTSGEVFAGAGASGPAPSKATPSGRQPAYMQGSSGLGMRGVNQQR